MLAIIPARGGSKGVPGKNIKTLYGKPLIIWTIEAASRSQQVDRVILSTDDEAIAEVCRNTGVEIPFMRPSELAQDDSLAIDNYIYTIERLNNEFNDNCTEFVVLQPTSPLRSSEDINRAIELFYKKNASSVISCVKMSHPLEWALRINEKGLVERDCILENKDMMNRQEIDCAYMPNGAIMVFKYSLLKEKYSYYSEKTYAYVMPPHRSIDIDSELDFEFASFLINNSSSFASLQGACSGLV